MKLIIKQVTIIDPSSTFHNQKVDVKIANGIFEEIGQNIKNLSDYKTLQMDDLHLSKGWFDSSVSFGEPGFEERETIQNGLVVAAKSGFTTVALQANSNPIIDNQSQIEFVKQKAKNSATNLLPIGAFTKNSNGNDLAEMFDMKKAGAIAFGDYQQSTSNANLLKIGLQYVQDFNSFIIAFCQDKTIAGNGVVNEGIMSTQLGLKAISTLAEEIIVARNLFLLEYTGGKMHIPTISSAKSVALIAQAKNKGLQVTCSVAVHNLVLTDEKLDTFDSRYKVLPPLQNEENRKALLDGILNNTIDCITTDHNPIDIEHKKQEFDTALYGTIGLESAFGALNTILPIETIIEKLTFGATIFNQKTPSISQNNVANFSLFTTNDDWVFTKDCILSKSKNSAFFGIKMKGKAVGIYNNNQLILA